MVNVRGTIGVPLPMAKWSFGYSWTPLLCSSLLRRVIAIQLGITLVNHALWYRVKLKKPSKW